MEKRKVYLVTEHHWYDGLGEPDTCDEWNDSVWSDKCDAQRRIDDLANEWIRNNWYAYGAIRYGSDWEFKVKWNAEKTCVTCSDEPYSATTYSIEELIVNPDLEDFKGP